MPDDPLGVGVLAIHSSTETKAILNAVAALDHEPRWLRGETTLSINDGVVTFDPDVDVVVNRLLLSNSDAPAEGLGLAATFDRLRPLLNRPEAVMTAMHKFAAATTLAEARIPVPDAVLALSSERLAAARDRFGPVAVYKNAIGTHGDGTWKLGADDQLPPAVGGRQAFLQALIERDPTAHRDLRIYVVDDEITGGMYRSAPAGDWRTNVSRGGAVSDAAELPDDAAANALDAVAALDLDYAGVDLVEGHEGWFVLEVNPTAGFKGLYAATGKSPAPAIAGLAIERAGGDVEPARVAELATTLDTSLPAAVADPTTAAGDAPPLIGYIEEVVVSGTAGSKRTYAKADTGATRTSIDTALAADIGAGPIKRMTRVKSGSHKGGKSRPVIDIAIGIGDTHHTVAANVEDRSHMSYPLLLGRDILSEYRVDVRQRADSDAESGRATGGAEE